MAMITMAPEDVAQIWQQFKLDMSDQELRNRLVELYLPLVKYNGERIWSRLPDGVELDDLISAGVFGLMDAAGHQRTQSQGAADHHFVLLRRADDEGDRGHLGSVGKPGQPDAQLDRAASAKPTASPPSGVREVTGASSRRGQPSPPTFRWVFFGLSEGSPEHGEYADGGPSLAVV